MTQPTRSRILLCVIFGLPLATLLAVFISELAAPALTPLKPLPDPNGYDDLLRAGTMVATNSWTQGSPSLEQLRETTAANIRALARARAGLRQACRVPLQFSQTYMETHISDLVAVRKVAQAFIMEGTLAELENRPRDAAPSFLDAMRLGNAAARGGALVDQMVGTACESVGTDHVRTLSGRLDANGCRETAAALEILDTQRQTWDEVMQQEHDWSERTFSGVRYELMRLMARQSMQRNFLKAEHSFQEKQLKTRQLMLDLAARAYALDQGHPPSDVGNLVPDYLKAVPQDPFAGTNLVYSPR